MYSICTDETVLLIGIKMVYHTQYTGSSLVRHHCDTGE